VDDKKGTAGPPYQSETQHAAGLLKYHVGALAAGASKVFWAWGITEGFVCECCLIDYTGLVYDGNTPPNPDGCDANDPYDLGKGVKKLAFFTHQLMVSTLEGSSAVTSLSAPEPVRTFRFTKAGRTNWVLWANSDEGGSLTLELGSTTRVRITPAVPAAERGLDVVDAQTAFAAYEQDVDITLQLDLSSVPIFVEAL